MQLVLKVEVLLPHINARAIAARHYCYGRGVAGRRIADAVTAVSSH